MTKHQPLRLLALSLLALLLGSAGSFAADAYGEGRLTIKEYDVKENGDIHITFRPMAETMWWCPGADAELTPAGIELTFVRAGFKKRPEVDYPAKRHENDGGSVIVVPAGGKPVFVRDGKKLVKLDEALKWGQGEEIGLPIGPDIRFNRPGR